MSLVLDASALLAFLHGEPGAEVVGKSLNGGLVSALNWSEIVQKSIAHGVDVRGMREDFSGLGLSIVDFTPAQAELAAALWRHTHALGLSLADRACLSLGMIRECPVVTADRAWSGLALDLEVRLIR